MGTCPSLDYCCTISLGVDVRAVSLLVRELMGLTQHKGLRGRWSGAARVTASCDSTVPCQGSEGAAALAREHNTVLMGSWLDHPIKMRLLVSTGKRQDPPGVFCSSVVLMNLNCLFQN